MPGLTSAAVVAVMLSGSASASASDASLFQEAAPRVLLDQSPKAIEYQLSRLSNEELARVERRPDDPKYRLVYYAILTRPGMPKNLRGEALGVLAKMDGVAPSQILLQALPQLKPEDQPTAGQLLALLFGQPAAAIRAQRDLFVKAASDAHPFVRSAGFGALTIADGDPAQAWQGAVKDGQVADLLRAVPFLPAEDLRAKLFAPISALLSASPEPATRAAAITALGFSRRDAVAFDLIARELDPARGADPAVRTAAVAVLGRIPEAAWPKGSIEPAARSLVAMLKDTPADRRTEPAVCP